MNTSHGTPSDCAAQASASAWLPALPATTPRRARSPRAASLATAPRILNAPVRCRFSAFSTTGPPAAASTVAEVTSGVRRTSARPASRAAAIRSPVGSSPTVGTRRCCRRAGPAQGSTVSVSFPERIERPGQGAGRRSGPHGLAAVHEDVLDAHGVGDEPRAVPGQVGLHVDGPRRDRLGVEDDQVRVRHRCAATPRSRSPNSDAGELVMSRTASSTVSRRRPRRQSARNPVVYGAPHMRSRWAPASDPPIRTRSSRHTSARIFQESRVVVGRRRPQHGAQVVGEDDVEEGVEDGSRAPFGRDRRPRSARPGLRSPARTCRRSCSPSSRRGDATTPASRRVRAAGPSRPAPRGRAASRSAPRSGSSRISRQPGKRNSAQ